MSHASCALAIAVWARFVDADKDRAATVTGRKAKVPAPMGPVVKSSSVERVRPVGGMIVSVAVKTRVSVSVPMPVDIRITPVPVIPSAVVSVTSAPIPGNRHDCRIRALALTGIDDYRPLITAVLSPLIGQSRWKRNHPEDRNQQNDQEAFHGSTSLSP
jgi:hypothetical protein